MRLGEGVSGRKVLALRGPISADIPLRALAVHIAASLLLVALGSWAMAQGDRDLSAGQVWDALMGRGPWLDIYFVNQVRLPRVVAAAAVGAALGISGRIFQTLSGNSLGSPDIIGFTHGAATGALVQIILLDAGPLGVALGAVLGGFATALIILVLTLRTGLRGYRLVLIGIGVGAALGAVNSLLVVRASLSQAQTAASWLAGSLNTMTWTKTALILGGLALLAPVLLKAQGPLAAIRFGDAVAMGLGVRVPRWRNGLLLVGVLLVGLATAVTGPLAFVALAAPHIARGLTRTPDAGLGASGLIGAVLVLGSDLIGQYALPMPLNVGVVTGALGGVYLLYIMISERKKA